MTLQHLLLAVLRLQFNVVNFSEVFVKLGENTFGGFAELEFTGERSIKNMNITGAIKYQIPVNINRNGVL